MDLIYESFPSGAQSRNRKGNLMTAWTELTFIHLVNTLWKFIPLPHFFFFGEVKVVQLGFFITCLLDFVFGVQTSCCNPNVCVCVCQCVLLSVYTVQLSHPSMPERWKAQQWGVCCMCSWHVLCVFCVWEWWAGTSRQPAVASPRPGIPRRCLSNFLDQRETFFFSFSSLNRRKRLWAAEA